MKGWMAIVFAFMLGVLCGLIVLVAPVAIRNYKSAWQSDMCRGNLAAIHAALQRYADSHGGNLPTSLDVLVEEHLVVEELLHCPASGKRYIYFFEGEQVHEDAAFFSQFVLADQGFPHPYRGGLKLYRRWGGGFGDISVQEFSEQLEKDPSRLAELIELWLVRQREQRAGEH